MVNDIAVSGVADGLVSDREQALKEYHEGLKLIAKASARIGSTLLGNNIRSMSLSYDECSLERALDAGRKEIDNSYWKKLFVATGLTYIFNSRQLDEFYFNLKTSPEFNITNITSTVSECLKNRPATLIQGLVDSFSSLVKSKLKRNKSSFKMPMKFIVEKVFNPGMPGCFYSWNDNEFHLNDIEKAIYICNGENVPKRENAISEILKNATKDGDTGQLIESRFLDCRVYINGNVHCSFRNADDLNAVNNLIAIYYGNTLGAN